MGFSFNGLSEQLLFWSFLRSFSIFIFYFFVYSPTFREEAKNYGAKDCQINQQGTVAKATAPVNYSVLSGVSKNTQIGFVIIHNNLTKFYEFFYIFL